MKPNMTIYDGNNWFRRTIEADKSLTPIGNAFYRIQNDPADLVVVVWDGFNGNARRREIYPDYKKRRTPPTDDFFASQNLFKKLVTFSKAVSFEVPSYEGDDTVAYIVNKYKDKFDIRIESNDADLWQLGVPLARDGYPEKPEWMVLYKATVGDSSDNIPGIKGFGEKSWEALDDHQKQHLYTACTCYKDNWPEHYMKEVEGFVSKAVFNWLSDKDNRNQVFNFIKIINFLPIPDSDIENGMKQGYNRPDLAENVLKEIEFYE